MTNDAQPATEGEDLAITYNPWTDGTQPAIEVKDLAFAYKNQQALSGITFTVARGSINGFVGPNGAGKTTTLKILATLLLPQSGTVRIFGRDVVRGYKDVRGGIGFMPDHFSSYRQMTVFEYLDFFAAAYGLDLAQRDKTVTDVLALTDLTSRKEDFVQALSRGMQQRLSLARVLVNDPDLLLLDEPASGLDPRARIELMDILQELRRLGKTIFISSHILSELGDLCDSFTIIDRGAVRYAGPVEGLTAQTDQAAHYVLHLSVANDEPETLLRGLDGMLAVDKDEGKPHYRLKFDPARLRPNTVLKAVLDCGAEVVTWQRETVELKKAFMDLTTPGVAP